MPHVSYNRSFHQNGFRLYGLTNPWAATQLSGVPPREEARLGHVFGPETLGGSDEEMLGQSHPFTPRGGWMLHGLGDIVPDQSVVTYRGQWNPGYLHSASATMAAVSSALAEVGLPVRSISSDAGFFSTTVAGNPFNVTMQIQVNNGMGFGDPSDITADIRHAVYVATGVMPLADSIVTVQVPGGAPQATGQPSGPGNFPTSGTDWNTWLQANAPLIGLSLVGVILLPKMLDRFL